MLTSKLVIDAGNGVDAQVRARVPRGAAVARSPLPAPHLHERDSCRPCMTLPSRNQGLGVPSFAHFLKLGEKKTPKLSQTFKRQQSIQLSSGRIAQVRPHFLFPPLSAWVACVASARVSASPLVASRLAAGSRPSAAGPARSAPGLCPTASRPVLCAAPGSARLAGDALSVRGAPDGAQQRVQRQRRGARGAHGRGVVL